MSYFVVSPNPHNLDQTNPTSTFMPTISPGGEPSLSVRDTVRRDVNLSHPVCNKTDCFYNLLCDDQVAFVVVYIMTTFVILTLGVIYLHRIRGVRMSFRSFKHFGSVQNAEEDVRVTSGGFDATITNWAGRCMETTLCGRTIRKRPHSLPDERIKSVEGNLSVNVVIINKWYRSKSDILPVMYGNTTVDGKVFPFPMYCDKKTFLRFYDEHFLRCSSAEQRDFLLHSIVTPSMKHALRSVFSPILWRIPALACSTEVSPMMLSMFNMLAFALLSHLGIDVYHVGAFSLFMTFMMASPDSLFYAFCEESLTCFLGSPLPVIAFESVTRLHICPIMVFMPALMHLFVWQLPYPLAVVSHWIYNRGVMLYTKEMGAGSVVNVEFAAYIIDFLKKLLEKDFVGLALSVGMKSSFFLSFNKLLSGGEEKVDFQSLSMQLETESGDDVVMLSGWDEFKYSFIFDWIPVGIRKSPTFSKVTALAVLIFQSQWFVSWEPLMKFGRYVTSEDFLYTGDVATSVFNAMKSVYNGLERVIAERNFMAFWDMPRDVYFVSKASQLLYEGHNVRERSLVLANMAEARSLIDSRMYLTNSSEISRMTDALRRYIVSQNKFLSATDKRVPPIVIWSNGPPGTGKTNLHECLKHRFAQRDKFERFPGDTIFFDINDKYPTSTGANPDAVFLELNDIPSIYTEFPKMDLLPLDVILQRVFDTCPLSFRAAAVEDKGLVLNKIRYVFISSNHESFKCPGETEKLQRRLEDGILIDCRVESPTGKILQYSQYKDFTQAERNASWKFVLNDIKCTGNFIRFERTDKKLSFPDFIKFVESRVDKNDARNKKTISTFQDGCLRCPCGIPLAMHEVPLTRDAQIASPNGKSASFSCISPICADETGEYLGFIPYNSSDPWGAGKVLGAKELDGATGGIAAAIGWVTFLSPLLTFLPLVGPLWFFMMTVALFINKESITEVLKWLLKETIDEKLTSLEKRLLTNDLIFDIALNLPWNSKWSLYYLRAKRTYYRVTNWLYDYKWVIGAGGVALFAAYWIQKKKDSSLLNGIPIYPNQVRESSIALDVARSEMAFPLEQRRQWNKGEADINVSKPLTVGVGVKDLELLIRRSVHQMSIKFEGFNPTDVKVAIVSPEYAMMNKHYVFDSDGLPRGQKFKLNWSGVDYPVELADLLYDSSTEFLLFNHSFPTVPSPLYRFFPSTFMNQTIDIHHVAKEMTYARVAHHNLVRGYQVLEWTDYHGEKGDCMEGVIGETRLGAVIVGFLGFSRNGSNDGGCFLVSRQWYDGLVSRHHTPHVNDVELQGFPLVGLDPLSVNAELRNVPSPYLVSLGTFPGGNRSFSSSLRPSRLYDELSPKLSEPYGIPKKLRVINSIDGVPQYSSAFTTTFKHLNYECNLTRSETLSVISNYLDRVASIDDIKRKDIKLSPITLKEAFFGCPELGIDRIDFKTSMGPLLRAHGMRNKFDAFQLVEQEEGLPVYELKEVMLGAIKSYDVLFKSGTVPTPLVDLVPKDEVRPLSKLEVAKIRLFCVLDAALNIYARMYLMPIIVYLLQFRELSECYGGMNAGSTQWNDLANRLKGTNRIYFDMDFSSFDVSHSARIFEAAAIYFWSLSLRLGYDAKSAEIVYMLFICFKWQVGKYGNDFFMKFKGMPSGAIFTLIMNSFVNSFLLRVAYFRLVGSLASFDANVCTGNVGDDNVNSVAEELKEKFNMITIAVEYRKLGYVATPAKKNGTLAKWIAFEELTFLKRTFSWSVDLRSYVAPIDRDSILKAFCFESRDCNVTTAQRLEDVANGAMREAFLHGRAYFDEFSALIKPIFEKHQLRFPTLSYEKLQEEYVSNVFRTYML